MMLNQDQAETGGRLFIGSWEENGLKHHIDVRIEEIDWRSYVILNLLWINMIKLFPWCLFVNVVLLDLGRLYSYGLVPVA